MSQTQYQRRGRGFRQTGKLLQSRIRAASETRGFGVARVLTHWEEVVGVECAGIARPVDIRYGRKDLGATLTVLTTGAHAPVLQARLPELIERVNACYGYKAVTRIRITQTAPVGFGEAAAGFAGPERREPAAPTAAARQEARATADGVGDPTLRAALERLGARIMTVSENREE